MGIFNQRDVYTNKWITAEVFDQDNRCWPVPIKHKIGNHFLAVIDKQWYCFTLKEARIKTIYNDKSLAMSAKLIHYYTDNANPINPEQTKALADLLEKNNLPKVNQKLFGVLKILANNEYKNGKGKDQFEPHVLEKLIEQIKEHEDKYPENVKTLENFINDLPTEQIVHPVKKITDYLEEDMIAPDPSYLGNIASTVIGLDDRHKVVTNEPAKNKKQWGIIIAAIAFGALAIAGVVVLMNSNLIPHIPGTGGGATVNSASTTGAGQMLTVQDVAKAYPDPQLLRLAIQNGQVTCDHLEKAVKDYVNTIKPSVCP